MTTEIENLLPDTGEFKITTSGRTYTARGATIGQTGSIGGLTKQHVLNHIQRLVESEDTMKSMRIENGEFLAVARMKQTGNLNQMFVLEFHVARKPNVM